MAEMTLCGDAADKYRLSLGGISSSGKEPLALQEFLRQHPEITTIELRLDNDAKGRMASVNIQNLYRENHNKKSVKISLNLFALYAVMVCGIVFALPAFAADDPLVVVENLSTFIFSLIRAVGLILLGWGIVQVGLSLQSHDPSQRSQGFLTLAGGLVITFAKEILDLITA